MKMDEALVIASKLGDKLHNGFVKLFSGEIEEDEIARNDPNRELEISQKKQSFLDWN